MGSAAPGLPQIRPIVRASTALAEAPMPRPSIRQRGSVIQQIHLAEGAARKCFVSTNPTLYPKSANGYVVPMIPLDPNLGSDYQLTFSSGITQVQAIPEPGTVYPALCGLSLF